MLYVVTGGSGSGKSEFAEALAEEIHRKWFGRGKLYYAATMYPQDEECRQRIRRHRSMRQGKGFLTVECCTGIENLAADGEDVVLLECMSNLLANEMYLEAGRIKSRNKEAYWELCQAVLQPVWELSRRAGCLIVVTNEVFSDGRIYDQETNKYLDLLGSTNRILARKAEGVAEVVYTIPVWVKGEKLCFDPL